ncbi:MAG: hypothetical protein D6692_02660, partial [Planctomycetota bacterium]
MFRCIVRGEPCAELLETEPDLACERGVRRVVVGEVDQSLDGESVDVCDQVGQAFGVDAADAFERVCELWVLADGFEGFERDLVCAAEAEFGHAGLVPVVEDGVDEVEGDFGLVHAGKVRRGREDSSGRRRMYTKSRTNPVHAMMILEAEPAAVMRVIQRERMS